MAKRTTAAALYQHWVHSHEEDTDTESVYRPASYKFPPSRGRRSFDIKADGTVTDHRIGPDDRSLLATGSWKFQEEGPALVFYEKGSTQPKRVLHIASISKDRLVLKK